MSMETLKTRIEAEFAALVAKVESIFGKNNQVTAHINNTASTVLAHVDSHAPAGDAADDAALGSDALASGTAVSAISTQDAAALVPDGAADDGKPQEDTADPTAEEQAAALASNNDAAATPNTTKQA